MTAALSFEWPGSLDDSMVARLAGVLYEAMRVFPVSYTSPEDARREVRTFEADDRLLCTALQGDDLIGWGGLIAHTPHAWELHPLCVAPDRQGSGVGRAIVAELERRAARGGARTLWLGTEDEVGATSLYGVDLYPDALAKLASMRVEGSHPIAFYQRLGFVVTGVIPDASGPGRHDFIMSKRLG